MSKHGSGDRCATGGRRQRKSIILKEKLYVIRRYVITNIKLPQPMPWQFPNRPNGTIGIKSIKSSCKSGMRVMASKTTHISVPIMGKFERILVQWMKHKSQRAIPLSTMIIQAMVESFFDELNATDPDLKVPPFNVRAAWFKPFNHNVFCNLKLLIY
jgi:hypothetical protein